MKLEDFHKIRWVKGMKVVNSLTNAKYPVYAICFDGRIWDSEQEQHALTNELISKVLNPDGTEYKIDYT